ncbi:uncharacterized protein isoform X1 [Leptinotarsa decemlineata]|uniref:uncharacterized protein isoform X1 n=2 Tax=Leptinotarsa decemlineata TaxID=7539 RepID=UPI003D30B8E3
MKIFLISILISAALCPIYSFPQMMGMGMGGMGQDQQSQMSEMGTAMGLNIGLGLSGGNYERSSQMGHRRMNRRRSLEKADNPGCYGRRQSFPTAATTTTTSTTTESIDPRES